MTEPATGLTRDEYFAERELLLEARQRSYQRAEQMVAGGATGALVLSITFLEQLVPAAAVRQSVLLVTAWGLLLTTLLVSLIGQYVAGFAFNCELARLDALANDEQPSKNKWRICNATCSFASVVLFVGGIAALAWFAYVNAPFNVAR